MKELIKTLEDLGYKEVSNPLTGQNDCNDKVDMVFDYDKGYFRYFTKKQEKTLDEIYKEWREKNDLVIGLKVNDKYYKVKSILKNLI